MMNTIISLIAAAVTFGTVLMYGTLGEVLTERSGNLNLGVEGIMFMGGAFGLGGVFYYEQAVGEANSSAAVALLIALASAFAAGAIASLIFSFLTITLRAPGTASSARRMSVLPSSSAASLLPPKRRPLPAAMTRQPRESVCSIDSSPCQFLQSSIPIFGHNCKNGTKFSAVSKKCVISQLR